MVGDRSHSNRLMANEYINGYRKKKPIIAAAGAIICKE